MNNRTRAEQAVNAEVKRLIALAKMPPHGDPYHVCIRLKVGTEHRHKIPNFIVVRHDCTNDKPRFRWIAPLPEATLTRSRRGKK